MKIIKKASLTFLIVLISIASIAQKTIDFPKSINFIKMTEPGVAVIGTDDALYGIDPQAKELWKNTKFKKLDAKKISVLEGSELIVVRGGLRGGTNIVNVLTGNIQAGGDISEARVIHGSNQIWIQTRLHGIHVWDIATNQEMYVFDKINLPYGVSSKYNFAGSQPITYTSEDNAILHIGLGQLGEYNLLTGNPIWEFDWKPYKVKKPNKDKGDRASDPGKGWARMQLDDTTNTLYFPFRNMLIAVDSKTGKAKWDIKANKVSKIFNLFVTDDGIVIHTGKGIELINKETGMPEWDKPIKIKGSGGLLINDNGDFYVVAKKSIEKIDIANKKSKALTEKIKFQGGESFSDLEIIDDIVVLSGSQNVVGINKNSGEIVYKTYHKAPGGGIGGIAKGIIMTGIAVAGTMDSYYNNSAAGNDHYTSYTPAMQSANGTTIDSGNNLYISTKFKEKDANGFGIAKVDKKTGETGAKVVIGNRDPIYAVDENNGIMYYKSDKSILSIKSIK